MMETPTMKKTLFGLALATASLAAMAQMTPAGLWKTIDDDGKTEKSLVRITEVGGAMVGKVEKISDPAKAAEKCTKCEGERANQPIVGMTILWGAKKDEDEPMWVGGQILDPNNGNTYKLRLKPTDGGKKLDVRGYIGIPMAGRTQTWVRVE
jgi:uncharacterized protein (DUF2147 family)